MEHQYLHLVDGRHQPSGAIDDENFMICPRAFYEGLTEREITAMQQTYKVAYERARQKVMRNESGYIDGDGI